MKINVSLDDKLIERIDHYAENYYMSRSSFVSLACTQFLNQSEVVFAIKDLSLAMQKIAKDKTVDVDTLERLEEFERISRMLLND